MTQESHPQENAKMAIDTALLVFYLTALAYIAAFSYEAGYLYHFGLWLDFVEVDLKQLLIAFGVMSAFVGAVWTGSDAVTHMWSQLVARKVWGRLPWGAALFSCVRLFPAVSRTITGPIRDARHHPMVPRPSCEIIRHHRSTAEYP
jgi:hypothetical protein